VSFSLAPEDDVWYRWLLKKSEPQPGSSGIIKYYEDMFEAPTEPRPWFLELSGRLESLSPAFLNDVRERVATLNAKRRKPDLAYRGRWKALTADIRAANFEVMREPTGDQAHANIVVEDAELIDAAGKIVTLAVKALHATMMFEEP
jgi:hypothetical protein